MHGYYLPSKVHMEMFKTNRRIKFLLFFVQVIAAFNVLSLWQIETFLFVTISHKFSIESFNLIVFGCEVTS